MQPPEDQLAEKASKDREPEKRGYSWMIWCLIVFGIILRFYNLSGRLYWHDEALTSHHVSGYTYSAMVDSVAGRLVQFKDLAIYQRPNPGKGPECVLNSLSYCQPEHSPLFYLTAYMWARTFGHDIGVMRLIPAIFGLLQLPCIYWLAVELFAAPFTAQIAAALIALSPLQFLYAREVREYSLFVTIICLLSALFLRAVRKPSVFNWALYLLALSFSFYSSVLTTFIIIAHLIYLISLHGFRWSKDIAIFLGTVFVAGVSFIPWIVQMLHRRDIVENALSWLTKPVTFGQLINSWLDSFPKCFLDLGGLHPAVTNCLTAFILPLELYALYVVLRRGRKQPSFLVIILFLVPAIAFPCWDIFFGGRRSMHMNYMMSIPVAVVLALACTLSRQLSSSVPNSRKLGSIVAAFVFACEISSCAIMSQAVNWPGQAIANQDLAAVADVLNADPQVLLVTERGKEVTNFMQLLALSHRIKENAYVQFFEKPAIPNVPEGMDHFYLFDPSPGLLDLLNNNGYTESKVGQLDYLWIARKSKPLRQS